MGSFRVAGLALLMASACVAEALAADPPAPGEAPRRLPEPRVPPSVDEPTALAREAFPGGPAPTDPTRATTHTATTSSPEREPTTTETATAATPRADAAPTELGEAPLSDEDLALLAALDTRTATTSTRAAARPAPTWWLAPAPLPRATLIMPRARLVEAAGRTLAESLGGLPDDHRHRAPLRLRRRAHRARTERPPGRAHDGGRAAPARALAEP